MNMNRFFLTLYALLFSVSVLDAQTTKEEVLADINKAGSNYLTYSKGSDVRTPAPKGYKPVYISHYGRHGSRYYISEEDFEMLYETFNSASKAKALTAFGEDVKNRFFVLWGDIKGRESDLTTLGMKQHRGIAERMFRDYPTLFAKVASVDARSTARSRCILSMSSFLLRLKELNPKLELVYNASEAEARTLSPENEEAREARMKDPEWTKRFSQFHNAHIHPDRMIASLFSDEQYVAKNIDKVALMRKIYDISCSLQGVEHLDITLTDLFTKEELFDNWQVQNAWWYGFAGPSPINGKETPYEAQPLLERIVKEAQSALEGGTPQVSLRFGHDIPLMGLLSLMRIDNCFVEEYDLEQLYTKWCDFKIIPMASNLQMVFYKAKEGSPVLVKFLLNEKEVGVPVKTNAYPYYDWNDVVGYFSEVLQHRK